MRKPTLHVHIEPLAAATQGSQCARKCRKCDATRRARRLSIFWPILLSLRGAARIISGQTRSISREKWREMAWESVMRWKLREVPSLQYSQMMRTTTRWIKVGELVRCRCRWRDWRRERQAFRSKSLIVSVHWPWPRQPATEGAAPFSRHHLRDNPYADWSSHRIL